ncbi:hypothetical protein CCACVL1_06700, partial [Corchorus capsularis]
MAFPGEAGALRLHVYNPLQLGLGVHGLGRIGFGL